MIALAERQPEREDIESANAWESTLVQECPVRPAYQVWPSALRETSPLESTIQYRDLTGRVR